MDQLNETSIQSWMSEVHFDVNNTDSISPWITVGRTRRLRGGGSPFVIDYTILHEGNI